MLDASVAIAWCFHDETTPFTEGVLNLLSSGSEAFVPAIWPLEVANVLLNAERRRRINAGQVDAFLHRIFAFPISIESAPRGRTFDQIVSMARQQRLSAYDAAYFELASRRVLPLATLDHALRRAALSFGITLVTP